MYVKGRTLGKLVFRGHIFKSFLFTDEEWRSENKSLQSSENEKKKNVFLHRY